MRWIGLTALLLITVASTEARADCLGPHDCYCGAQGSQFMALATITDIADEQAVYRVDEAIGPQGVALPAGLQVGATLNGRHLDFFDTDEGDRVLIDVEPDLSVGVFGPVVQTAEGTSCRGFTSETVNLRLVATARLSDDCSATLVAAGATFESPPCNDTVVSPFGCTSTPGPQTGGLLLGLLAFARIVSGRRWSRRRPCSRPLEGGPDSR